MTFAVIMQVDDGLVLATDSASTISAVDENGNNTTAHVYFNADKVFNLIKGQSVGCMTWGSGSIAKASITTLVKDFREDYSKKNKDEIKKDKINISSIANSFSQFIQKKIDAAGVSVDLIGFIIAGYSTDENNPEIFLLEFSNEGTKGPKQINKDKSMGIKWYGEIEYTSRLLLGISAFMPEVLDDNDFDDEISKKIINIFKENLQLPIGASAMPIQDAIDFIDFLVDFNCQMSKFMPGAQTIGGPVDLAVITRHENFKWIKRKHYFSEKLNRSN